MIAAVANADNAEIRAAKAAWSKAKHELATLAGQSGISTSILAHSLETVAKAEGELRAARARALFNDEHLDMLVEAADADLGDRSSDNLVYGAADLAIHAAMANSLR